MKNEYKIAAFYRFTPLKGLEDLKTRLALAMEEHLVNGTIIIAGEGFNGTVSAKDGDLNVFLPVMESILGVAPDYRFSRHDDYGFKRRKVKIKKEIVTLKKNVDIDLGTGTHVSPAHWNEIINDPEVILIDARNDYEYKLGTFKGAINPKTGSFSELPGFIEHQFDPEVTPKIAMFCTGGIRCEKLAPYLLEQGFKKVFQLDGGILGYLEKTEQEKSLWEGECFVFDDRVTVDEELRKGKSEDVSFLKKLSQKK